MQDKINLENVSLTGKETWKLPKGATIVKKDVSIRVEEIENGYIVSKSYDIKWEKDGDTSYDYFTKRWYSEDNPLKDSLDELEETMSLADKFED